MEDKNLTRPDTRPKVANGRRVGRTHGVIKSLIRDLKETSQNKSDVDNDGWDL